MNITHLDHLVLTVSDIEATCLFYETVMGMKAVTFGDNRHALSFGHQKINLHLKGKEINPKAANPTTGSADLCFISSTPVDEILEALQAMQIPVLEGGIVDRTGAKGSISSVYFRDPDLNLIEVSNYK